MTWEYWPEDDPRASWNDDIPDTEFDDEQENVECPRCKGTNCKAAPFRDLPYGAICRNLEHKCPDCVDGRIRTPENVECLSERPGGCGLGAPWERPRPECPDCAPENVEEPT